MLKAPLVNITCQTRQMSKIMKYAIGKIYTSGIMTLGRDLYKMLKSERHAGLS